MKVIKRILGIVLILVLFGAAGFFIFAPGITERGMNEVKPHAPYPVSPEAQALHDSLVIGDWHADTLLWNRDLNTRGSYGHVDFPRLAEGNVALQVFTAVTKTPAGMNYDANSAQARDNITLLAFGQLWPIRTWTSLFERALYQAERLQRSAQASGGAVRLVTTEADLDGVLAARAEGDKVIGALFGIEGGHALEAQLENLDRLEAAGLRVFGLHHHFDNALGGSLHGEGNHGLTDFGRAVVAEIVRRPIVLDLVHSSEQVARDVLALTDIPLVVSHTGLHSHCAVKRNFPDDLMREIVATGGVIGIGYWQTVTCDDSPAGIAATVKAAIAALGEDHVALGSDFDGTVMTTFDTSELAALTQAMLDAGLTEAQIRKVAGQNMLRVLRARLD